MKYHIIDLKTRRVIAVYTDRRRAERRADFLDLEYGAIRYKVHPVYPAPVCEALSKEVQNVT
jgi:hypothetical protein